jgi:hypothetical protein
VPARDADHGRDVLGDAVDGEVACPGAVRVVDVQDANECEHGPTSRSGDLFAAGKFLVHGEKSDKRSSKLATDHAEDE